MRRVILLLGALVGCGIDDSTLPPGREYTDPRGRSAMVEIVREVNSGIAAVPGCGILAGGVLYDGDGVELPATTHTGNLVGAADLNGDGVLDLVTVNQSGAPSWWRGDAHCNWAGPTALGSPLNGIARGVHRDGDRLRIGWSDGAQVCRTFRSDGTAWTEEQTPEPRLAIRRTWFVRAWGSRVLFGLDAGEGYSDPPLPAVAWAAADPMGHAEVHVGAERLLFIGGLPSRSMLLDIDGHEHAEEAGIRGPALTVMWQSAAVDLDGDARDDLVVLALAGHNSSDGRPAHPRVLLQLDGGRFATLPVQGNRLRAIWLACLGGTCAADGEGGAVLFRVTVTR